jgi:transcriptional regulator with XRE-family HTH domain
MASNEGTKTLAQWREARGLTQFQLAARSGASLSTVTGVEASRSEPRVSTAIKLAAVLGVHVEEIAWPALGELRASPSKRDRAKKP